MSVNLNKNKAQILDAWKKVTDNEDGYDWALFGYEGKSVDLKVDAIGSGGIETVAEEINEGKIQYAYVRVLDPNTKLVKFLLINFQGEAVLDLVHKGTCSNHIRDITKFLKNHLTITASNLDDLEEEAIWKKMSKITSTYNFQDRAIPTDEKFTVGTNYSKVVPTKEINVTKRDEFWKNESEVEKARKDAELEAKRLANLKLEEERLKREQSEHLKREQQNKEPEVKKLAPTPIIKPVSPVKTVEKDEISRPLAEELRMGRRKEAQELIGNRVNTAKAMFQQQAAQSATPVSSAPPMKPIRKTIQKVEPELVPVEAAPVVIPPNTINIPSSEPEIIPTPLTNAEEEDHEQFSTIKRSPKTPTSPDDKKRDNDFTISTDNGTNHKPIDVAPQQVQQQQEQHNQQIKTSMLSTPSQQLPGDGTSPETELLKAIALYDYQAVDETEISFDPGDIITHIDQIDEGWWQGFSERFGTYGLFPANYVELIN
ncbi:CLUMA_CG000615, isoform A [Clunio marinus]|uniref:CLUMA_CG000615, isoform A n=1 Tax=Clunio marinus TaxID=568069 RepID=A0A1J1HFL1_9DIPT|nr:CLUMA_CG000615, isoform A [Clunio marinus]